MSSTITPPPVTVSSTVLAAATPQTNGAVSRSSTLLELVANLRTADPALAQQIEGKSLLASRTPWGTLLAGIIAWGAAHYGLNLSPDAQVELAGLGVVIGSYAMRYVTAAPISSIVSGQKPIVLAQPPTLPPAP